MVLGSKLTPRQREILDYIGKEIRERGYPPSVREIGEAVGLSSSSTVHGHLARLEEKGFLRRDPDKPRAIEVTGERQLRQQRLVSVPLIGRVTAGEPILAVENIEETYALPYDWARGDSVFMLRVQGDSMIGAGIMDGDLVLVRQQAAARNGDIVVALMGEEATVKRFFHEGDRVRLQPENPALQPIVTRDVQVLGKVVGLYRSV
jgi:repressor LexA